MSTKLIDAVKTGNRAECTRLLMLEDIDILVTERELGRSAIIIASIAGHADLVDLLLSKGANINDKDKYGASSIMWASREGHVNVAELLLSKGANINDKDGDDSSSIIWASREGHVDLVELLLSKGTKFYRKKMLKS